MGGIRRVRPDVGLLRGRLRGQLRELDEDAVTTGELKESRLRKVAVETLEAQATYGAGNAAILKAIQANNAAIQNIRRREKNRAGLWTPILVEKMETTQLAWFRPCIRNREELFSACRPTMLPL